MSNGINSQLKELYAENWDVYTQKVKEWETQNYPQKISNPLCLSVADEEKYLSADLKVMIFGQETNGWYDADSRYEGVDGMQKAYLSFYKGGKFEKHKGQFKNVFNEIVAQTRTEYPNAEFIWNNIIKRGKTKVVGLKNSGKGKPPKALYDLECEYFKVIAKEVNILEIDVIIFLTGPNYDKNIERVFGTDKECYATIDGFTKRQFAIINGTGAKVAMRTYHPGYLCRAKGDKRYKDYLDGINKLVKNI